MKFNNARRIGKVYQIIIFLNFLMLSNGSMNSNGAIFWSINSLVIFSIIWLILNSKLIIDTYMMWIFLFSLIVIFSYYWSYNTEYAVEGIKSIFTAYIVFIFISMLLKTKEDFLLILKLFVISQLINVLYLMYAVDTSTIGEMRIGKESVGIGWNANDIGMTLAIASFVTFTLIQQSTRKLYKIFLYIIIILFSYMSLLSGSRKAFLILLLTIILSAVLNSKKKKILIVPTVMLIGISVIYIVINVPSLYSIMGSRIDSLLAQFTGDGLVDNSTTLRLGMIEYGVNLFYDNPLTGHGINNFRPLYGGLTGWYTYSHNNYIELLVGVGLLGTICYYSGYIYILFKTFSKKDSLLIFATISIITLLITEIGLVSYNQFYTQFLIFLSFSAIKISKKNKTQNIVSE